MILKTCIGRVFIRYTLAISFAKFSVKPSNLFDTKFMINSDNELEIILKTFTCWTIKISYNNMHICSQIIEDTVHLHELSLSPLIIN